MEMLIIQSEHMKTTKNTFIYFLIKRKCEKSKKKKNDEKIIIIKLWV